MAANFDFVENFWDPDIVGTSGFEAVVRRLKDGNSLCKEIEDFLKYRSSAERDYSTKLGKCSQTAAKAKGHDSDGLLASWDEFTRQSGAESMSHLKAANDLQKISKRIEELRTNQGETRKRLEDGVKRLQTQKKECYQKVLSNQERYESKSRDKDNAADTLEREKPMAKPADMTKLYQRLERCKKAAADADETYRRSLEQLEAKRKEWEASMVTFCQEAQKLEVERIYFLRNQLWEATNHVSEKCVAVDQFQEVVRKELEKCQPENDLQLFVQQKRTGQNRPATIEYQSYYANDSTAPSHHHISNGRPTPSGYPNLTREPLPTLPTPDYDREMNEGIYSSVPDSYVSGGGNRLSNPDQSSTNHCHRSLPQQQQQLAFRAKATYQYIAQKTDELSLHPGQTVTVLSKVNSNWWLVKINDQQGNVPSRFLEPIKESPRLVL